MFAGTSRRIKLNFKVEIWVVLNLLYKQNDFGLFYDAQNNPITKEVLDAE